MLFVDKILYDILCSDETGGTPLPAAGSCGFLVPGSYPSQAGRAWVDEKTFGGDYG